MVNDSAVKYQVTAKAFMYDDKPEIKVFDEWYEAEQWIQEEIECRVSWRVTHTPYYITEKDLADIEQEEASCIEVTQI